MGNRKFSKLAAYLNSGLRWFLWGVLFLDLIAITAVLYFMVHLGWQAMVFLPGPAVVFFATACVLALLTTLDRIIFAIEGLPDASAEALRRTGKPKPPPVPADLVPAAAPLLRPIGRVPAPESLIDVNAWDLPVVGKRLRK